MKDAFFKKIIKTLNESYMFKSIDFLKQDEIELFLFCQN